ncbi:branched-chain amino acid ABC transporter permease [Halostella sp. JP-L12]|uniref:branched-chain amino acid ABC transporter permease n=1 Tax=Halostella TaxID=1843185 RepID=UPI000EF7EF4F|nr:MULTISPECIES: branched-chain amino acid ABC transporter permease [Halostella]NHN48914.1 branched-chain amino acid ABC transporter permease [Halostella sp. JP-L12]
MTGSGLRAQARDLLNRDVGLVLAVLGGIYLAYILAGVAFGFGLRGQLNSIANLTFYVAVFGMLALALNLHWGYTGLFNIGVIGFMGIGVYVTAIFAKPPAAQGGAAQVGGFGLPLGVAAVLGVLGAALFGLLVGLPALRLRADYLAIVTIAFSEIMRFTFMSGTFQTFDVPDTVDLTVAGVTLFSYDPAADTVGLGGGRGLILNYADPLEALLKTLFLWDPYLALVDIVAVAIPNNPKPVVDGLVYGLVLLGVVGLYYWLLTWTGESPFGRVLKAIREDEDVANSLGKDTNMFKLKSFVLGCALMGFAGVLWYAGRGSITPPSFRPNITFFVWIALIIGGAGSNTGSVLGGAVFAALLYEGPRYFKNLVEAAVDIPDGPGSFGQAMAPLGASLDPVPFLVYTLNSISQLRLVIMGLVLIWLMHNRPEGMLGHRKEIAASVDLSRPDRGGPDEDVAVADGGERR